MALASLAAAFASSASVSNAVLAGAALGPPGILVSLGISVGLQIIGNLLKPRKKSPPQEILPWQTITAEHGTTIPCPFGTLFIENTMVLGVWNEGIETVPAPKSSNKKSG